MKNKYLIRIDLSGCKNLNEAHKAMRMIVDGKIKITVDKIKKLCKTEKI